MLRLFREASGVVDDPVNGRKTTGGHLNVETRAQARADGDVPPTVSIRCASFSCVSVNGVGGNKHGAYEKRRRIAFGCGCDSRVRGAVNSNAPARRKKR
jgi:hypothetical protein